MILTRLSLPLTSLLTLALSPVLHAQTAENPEAPTATAPTFEMPLGLSPDDASHLLQKLGQLHEDFAATKKELLSSALTRIRTAAASEAAAADLYLKAWKIVNIDRKPALPGASPAASLDTSWQDRQVDWMKETGSPKALRVQLAWLALTIEASQADPGEYGKLMPRARDLSKEAASAVLALAATQAQNAEPDRRSTNNPQRGAPSGKGDPRRGGGGGGGQRDIEGILTQSVMSSLFAQAYNLQNYIQPPRDWSLSAMNLDAVYGQMLLPHYRRASPAELPALWDEWINYEASARRAAMNDLAFLTWGQTQGKNLQWRKHMDLIRHGVGGRASGEELVRLFKENPTHPSLGTWKQELERLTAQIMGEDR
jgi:hypothetical protein